MRAEAARAGVDAVHPAHVVLRQEGVLQRLHEVEVLDAALRTGDGLTVVREEVEPLVRVDDQLAAGGALQPLRTAGHRGEDVVAVHRAEDELGAVPDLGAGRVPTLQSAGPALKTGHADSGEVTRPPLTLHLQQYFQFISLQRFQTKWLTPSLEVSLFVFDLYDFSLIISN